MKIFCVEGNCRDARLPLCWQALPDSTLLYSDRPFFVPDFDSRFVALLSPVVKISRLGKCVEPRFAGRYYSEWSVAISIRAFDMLERLKKNGLPWSEALVFDRSLIVGDFRPVETISDSSGITFPELSLRIDGEEKAGWNPGNVISATDEIVSLVSQSNTIKTGDLVLPAMTVYGADLKPGHILEISAGSEILLTTPLR